MTIIDYYFIHRKTGQWVAGPGSCSTSLLSCATQSLITTALTCVGWDPSTALDNNWWAHKWRHAMVGNEVDQLLQTWSLRRVLPECWRSDISWVWVFWQCERCLLAGRVTSSHRQASMHKTGHCGWPRRHSVPQRVLVEWRHLVNISEHAPSTASRPHVTTAPGNMHKS